jgi:peptide/nickel transport system permease protein
MFATLFQKFFYGLLTLFGVVSAVFFLFHVLPGDPARMLLDERQDATQLVQIKKKHGFDQPVSVQYMYYLNDLSALSLHSKNEGNYTALASGKYKVPYLRASFQKNGKPVAEVLQETFPNTAILAFSAIGIALLLGVFFGVLAALYKDTFFDRFIAFFSTLGMSVPSFLSAIVFAWLFGFVLKKYTHLNMTGSLYTVDDFGEGVFIQWKNLLLPAVVLGIRPLAVIVQLMRNSLLEVLGQDYIRTAKAKGLSDWQIVYRHAMKNALNPVVTAVSGWFASLLAGAVFVEYIFNWNGLGKEIVDALNTLDQPVLMGAVLLVASLFVLINICVDVLYGWLDPKIGNS